MSIRRAAVWAFASQYATFAIQFAVSVIISRFFLLPVDVGLFSIALAAAMVVSIFQDMGITRFVVGQPAMREEHVRDYAAVAAAIGWLIAWAVALAAKPLAQFYGEPGLSRIMLIIAASYVIAPLAIVPAAMLSRALNFRALFFANAGSALIGGAVAIVTAAKGAGPASLAWGMLATTAVRCAVVQIASPVFPRFPKDRARVVPLFDFGSSSFVISLSAAIGVRSQDLIVGRLLGVTATGLFTRASALAGQMSTLLTGAISAVFYPAFAKKRDSGEALDLPYLHLVACNTGLAWAAAIGLALAAEPLVWLLYGPNWMEVAPLLRWIALSEIFFTAVPLQMDIPILLGRIRKLVWINLLDTAMTVTLLTVFCLWGLQSAAISRLVVSVLWFALYISLIGFWLRLRPGALAHTYLRSAACAAAAGLPLAIAHWQGWASATMGFFPLAGLCLAGVLCWFAAVYLTRHPIWSEVRLARARLMEIEPVKAKH